MNIGRGIEKKREQENNRDLQTAIDYFSDEQVNHFLTAYFTFKNYGDNYSAYVGWLSPKAQENEAKRVKKSKIYPQFFGNSIFISSENYTRIVSERQIEVICKVTRKISSSDQDGKIANTSLANEVVLKLYYVFDGKAKQFFIEKYEVLKIR